jgi:predicted ATPase
MLLKTVFVRFYKSFNFDYLRKYHAQAERQPWEMIDDMWYPYVRVPIDPKVTTVVGANESGKSHLLTAIEKGVSGDGIEREDFCRYSQFFTVERGQMKWPDFGFEWDDLTSVDQQRVRSACNIAEGTSFDRFLLFRTNRGSLTVYIPRGGDYSHHELEGDAAVNFRNILPRVFRLDPEIALPDSVSIRGLAKGKLEPERSRFELINRRQRFGLLETFELATLNPDWFASPEAVQQYAAHISPAMSPLLRGSKVNGNDGLADQKSREFRLAYDLLCKVADVDPEALAELYRALRDGKEGHANGIIQEINDRLAATLNFPNWWVQDRNFRLVVSPREFDLVFTIRDRTNTDYSFNERSSGLKYFLSYYVQYRAHEPRGDRQELLLMDEPDAYLSSQAQQDLLKIFEAFAFPEDGRQPIQVIYVTHSPFLIDKNHAERIRVLEKGVGEEGTRVVKDAAKNHYEPLRSAFGAFVGETTFIGNCNLMVEGQADQILLAGAATHLRRLSVSTLETLDLNRVTIVPAGSAPHIPYMVYLARGRDVEQPAVIVLLDSDRSGNDARRRLRKGGAYGRQLLKDNFILQIGDLGGEAGLSLGRSGAPVEMEDLIPLPICAEAARKYAREVCGVSEREAAVITPEAISKKLTGDRTVFDAVAECFDDLPEDGLHIEKVGFARNVVEVVGELARESDPAGSHKSLEEFEANMKILFRKLNRIRREAERELVSERVTHKINRLKDSFLQDHPFAARREDAHVLFDDMEASLDDGPESDPVRIAIMNLRREFRIDDDMTRPIEGYEKFKEGLERVKYAGRIATQEPDPEDAADEGDKPPSDGGEAKTPSLATTKE